MPRRRSTSLITMYVLSLAATIALLVVWVVYVVRSGGPGWILLSVGCVLLFFLIVGLTYQLAQALAARRYAMKQDEFVANITHEMKSPLAAIKLHAQTLQQPGELDPDVRRRFLTTIDQQADRMAALVDAVLESSRLMAHQTHLELVPVDLAAFAAAYFGPAQQQAEARGVSLRPEVATRGSVMATEEALRRVLDNLIDNAVRFSQPKGEVRCRMTDRGDLVRIEVEDDGVGIPKKELPRIFDRFYQAGANRSAGGSQLSHGTGLGLAIVAGLVREMRGTVRAHSQEERPGTRLVVELPLGGRTG